MRRSGGIFILIVIIVAIINIWYWFGASRFIFYLETGFPFFSSSWSAVYLADGNVLVGRITDITSGIVKLSDPYLIQVPKADQTASTSSQTLRLNAGNLSNISLVRWGFFQPLKSKEDLLVNRQAVLFLEKLDDDSAVVQQIKANTTGSK